MKYYKGKYRPKNIDKYKGDYRNVVYRSSWERQVFKYLDTNSKVKNWSSETVVIPYRCATDNKIHRYFMDIKFTDTKGQTYLVEIKPKAQTKPPKGKRKTKRFITETLTYAKNVSKWEAAKRVCEERGWIFQIWHEDVLKALGIRILYK